jgi:hypothetical protein
MLKLLAGPKVYRRSRCLQRRRASAATVVGFVNARAAGERQNGRSIDGLTDGSEKTRTRVPDCREQTRGSGYCLPTPNRSRDTGTDSRASVTWECRSEHSRCVRRSRANEGSARARRLRRGQIRRRVRPASLRTRERRLQVRRRLRVLVENDGSSFGEPSEDACANFLPWLTGRLARHDASGTPFNFAGPGCFNIGPIRWRSLIEARKELGGQIRTLIDWQREGLLKNFLRP